MKRIQDLEGELELDHRNSPGLPEKFLVEAGLPLDAGRGLYRGPVYTCGHCQRGVNVIVTLRGVREKRYVCSGCWHVLCAVCAEEKVRTGLCVPFEARVEAALAGRALPEGIRSLDG